MANISSLGSGSGIDLNGLLTNIMKSEQQPMMALQRQEASYQSRISALGSLKGALSSLQTAASSMAPTTGTSAIAKYTTFGATVADTSIASASASLGAVSGSYSLEVSSLAQSQRLVTPAYPGGGASTVIGTGDLKIDFGKLSGGVFTADSLRSKTITIDSSNATLGGLRDAINSANMGATATIVTGTNGAQLILSSSGTGLSNVMQLAGTGTTPLSGFDYNPALNTGTLTQDALLGGQAATDAAFKLNGIAATSSTNSVTGALDGVTLTLLKTSPILTPATVIPPVSATYTPTTLTVSKNSTGSLTTSLNAFIKAYNEANKAMTDLGAYNATTKTAGALQGNATLRGARNQVQDLVSSATAGGSSPYQHLSSIGVSLGKDGSLSLDSTKLSAAVAADPTSVANLVAAVGSAYKTGIEGLVGTSGSITSATDGANRTIKDLTKRQQVLSNRLSAIETNYKKQFTALDSLVAGMKQTSSYLAQQLASLPGVTSSN
jgi:flagellar hook-associated protein 2